MERKTSTSFLLCILFSLLLFDHCICRTTLQDFSSQKTYYTSPDPHHSSPPHPHTHRRKPSCGSTPPHNYGSPPHRSSGGGHGGGGGYYNSPPSSSYTPTTPPSPILGPVTPTPTTPIISTPPSPVYIDPGTPTTPIISTPPSPIYIDPGTPTTPIISTPPSPRPFDPSSPPYYPAPCSYWITHPAAIWSLLGYWGTVGGFFGSSLAYGKDLTLHQALSNPRTDGIGELYREGAASLLNSMATTNFPFSSEQVKDAFTAALVSQKAAATQAEIFKLANEGKLKKKKH
ncbi:protodermal factor 1-like [Dioscorea cayenensis subsp. rotundata]|uniref:Protodermal factor 1-like n=1 Tax=Dioscorea cayennensis subsp. rotundata TaxID=55577 RepID=A0AB40AVW9_DIOCR|nr:protodermal factor 1-like [Dioscorea cayenensis subsp. rotundata]